ncbi:MAG: thermonuclease family protein [Alphaproteobacteria bacterium]
MATISTGALAGTASVVDGDTIVVAGQAIELHGIDAPEYEQNCHVGLEVWLCGLKATRALESFIGASPVTCQDDGVCFVRGRDLAAWMVLNGWALATTDYEDQERRARIAELGIWRGDFMTPWEWRRVSAWRHRRHCPPDASSRATSPSPASTSFTCLAGATMRTR